jgi:hypothetical protein
MRTVPGKPYLLAMATLITVVIPARPLAQVVTANFTNGTNFSTAANWSTGTVPGANNAAAWLVNIMSLPTTHL